MSVSVQVIDHPDARVVIDTGMTQLSPAMGVDEPQSDGRLRGRALDPDLVWIAHEHEPWRPR